MARNLILIIAFFILTSYVSAQEITNREIKKVTLKVADLVRSNYVLQEKGNNIAEYFLNDLKRGRFSGAKSWKELDSIMTKSLREISGDGHLYTWNNLDIVKQLKQEKENETKKESKKETVSFFNNKKAINSNFGFQKVEILEDNVGYIKLTEINISGNSLKTLFAAMEFVKNTKALILDLRNNGGGGSTVGSVLESFFFDRETTLLIFKNRNGNTEIKKTVPWLQEKRYEKPISILINKKTASAAEAFAFALKHQGRAVIIGEPSAGAAFMNTYFPINDHLVLAVSTAAPFLPGTELTWEQNGVQPEVTVTDQNALKKALKLIKK